jgi:putative endonuclease
MATDRQRLGQWGEDTAAEYLHARGYTILTRNFRTPRGEIDIVASLDDMLVFVEVKARSNNLYGYPEQAVSPRKQSRMLAAAGSYLQEHPESFATWQFDILAITRREGEMPEIEHFENVIG